MYRKAYIIHPYVFGVFLMLFDNEETVDVKDLMKLCKVTRRTVYKWIESEPKFPKPYKVGLKLFWKKSEIELYLESTKQK